MTREPWRQVLLDAADYIEAHGWCQNALEDHDGSVCVLGAIKAVGGVITGFSLLAHCALNSHVGGTFVWNDAPGRTSTEVCAVLREVARS